MVLVFASGSGNFQIDETVTNGDATAKVTSWDYSNKTLRVGNIVGTITSASAVVGSTSGASWNMTATPNTQVFTTDTYANNVGIQTESDTIFDFSDRDPISEGNY